MARFSFFQSKQRERKFFSAFPHPSACGHAVAANAAPAASYDGCYVPRLDFTGSLNLLPPTCLLLWDVDATTVCCRTYLDVELILLN